jgi:hypothetical protein
MHASCTDAMPDRGRRHDLVARRSVPPPTGYYCCLLFNGSGCSIHHFALLPCDFATTVHTTAVSSAPNNFASSFSAASSHVWGAAHDSRERQSDCSEQPCRRASELEVFDLLKG